MKKILALLLAVVMMFIIVGCTKADEQPSGTTPAEQGKYVDGTYIAFGNGTQRGFGMVEVTIENDVIVDVKVTEFDGLGVEKPEDYRHEPYNEAKAVMPGRFIEANGTDVETVSGATSSSNNWILAVERALEKALVEPISTNTYFDGTFYGASEETPRGRGIALVTLENDVIVDVVLLETTFTRDDNPTEVYKDAEYQYEAWQGAVVEMPGRFIEANGTDVEAFTGATSSTEKWIAAIESALEKATR